MKRLIALIAAITLLYPCAQAQTIKDAEGEWYPFVIPEKLNPNSPMNIGKLVLDAPAGKHGFVKVKDGHFYFEDGTRAKFWGTNLCFGACFPTKEQAELLADRLAFFGFNAVRLHHMDYYFEPRGIFKDVAPAQKDPQKKKTGVLSEKQLDRLDYLIYQLKLRGIYVDMNLLVSRHFTLSDGVQDADKLGMAAKPVSMFDPKLIELQKKYAQDLLTHYNSYTKLRYCDDPVIAMAEITNENSLVKKGNKNIPAYYSKQLQEKMVAWKTTNPGSREDFYADIEKNYFNEMTSFLKNNLKIKIPITGSQFSNLKTQSSCDFIDKHAYWDHPKFPNKKWDKNNFTIHNKSILRDPHLGIIGPLVKSGEEAKKFIRPFTVTEWNHCYPNQYAYETPLLLAATAAQNDWDALFQFAFSHGWQKEPVLNDIQSYFDILPSSQQLILCGIGSYMFLTKVAVNYSFLSGKGIIIDWPISKQQFGFGEIKNTNSGWKNNRFQWGNGPTLIRKIKELPFF